MAGAAAEYATFVRMVGVGTATLAKDAAGAAVGASAAAADAAVARMCVGAARSITAAGAQPTTAINGTGTTASNGTGTAINGTGTASNGTGTIACDSTYTKGGTANSRTESGRRPHSAGPTGIVATRGSFCNFG